MQAMNWDDDFWKRHNYVFYWDEEAEKLITFLEVYEAGNISDIKQRCLDEIETLGYYKGSEECLLKEAKEFQKMVT